MSRAVCSLSFLVLFCVLTVSTSAVGGESYYYYFKEKRVLPLDATRVAARSVVDTTRLTTVQSAAFADAQLDKAGISPWPVAGWSVIHIDAASAPAQGMKDRVAAAAQAGLADFVSPVFVGTDGGPVMVTPDLLVGFREGVNAAEAERLIAETTNTDIIERRFGNMARTYRLRSRAADGYTVLDEANRLAQDPRVKFAEPDMIFTGSGGLVPNDPRFTDCWGLDNTAQFGGIAGMDMSAVEAWDITTGDPSVIVVVIDTGVEQTHPDIHQLTPGTDTTSDASTDGGPVNGFDNHGTAVAGCVSASINNSLGTVGIAPGCLSASARTFIAINSNGNWTSTASWTVDSLAWAESIGARVSNNSNIYGFSSSAIATKYAATRDNGMVHFACAGNDGVSFLAYPSSLPTVNSVAALQESGHITSFSNYGVGLAFSAPGIDVMTTDRTGAAGWVFGDYVFAEGTSFASPYAAGVAALYLSRYPSATALAVEEVMQASAVDLGAAGYDTTYGWGFVNAYNVLQVDPACRGTGAPQAEPVVTTKNRYLSFDTSGIVGAVALRVTAVDLPAPYDVYNGWQMWVGAPALYTESVTRGTDFYGASLSCTPTYMDWSTFGVVHASGALIVPAGAYQVDALLDGCDPSISLNYSAPLELATTAPWGDIVAPFGTDGGSAQPDFNDISAEVAKFLEALDAPLLMAADVDPAEVNRTVDFTDISTVVDAFLGNPYALAGPVACP